MRRFLEVARSGPETARSLVRALVPLHLTHSLKRLSRAVGKPRIVAVHAAYYGGESFAAEIFGLANFETASSGGVNFAAESFVSEHFAAGNIAAENISAGWPVVGRFAADAAVVNKMVLRADSLARCSL